MYVTIILFALAALNVAFVVAFPNSPLNWLSAAAAVFAFGIGVYSAIHDERI